MILISSTASSNPDSLTERQLKAVVESASFCGWKTYLLGADLNFSLLPDSLKGQVMYNGFIPESYPQIAEQVTSRGGEMFNSVRDTQLLSNFTSWYPLIKDLTAASVVIEGRDDTAGIEAALKLKRPLFIKGDIKSNKEAGFENCLANSKDDLIRFIEKAETLPRTWRGRVIARELLDLRSQPRATGFPLSREYRVLLNNQQVIGKGFYWQQTDCFELLTPEDNQQINTLAKQVQRRLKTKLTLVDVGQLNSGEWVVIEVGDPQFSVFNHVSPLALFNSLK